MGKFLLLPYVFLYYLNVFHRASTIEMFSFLANISHCKIEKSFLIQILFWKYNCPLVPWYIHGGFIPWCRWYQNLSIFQSNSLPSISKGLNPQIQPAKGCVLFAICGCLNPRVGTLRASCIFIEKNNPCINRCVQFKSMLFKGQLYLKSVTECMKLKFKDHVSY